jgi:hypothetical protein
MKREEARGHFKNLGLSYAELTRDDIEKLHGMISHELSVYLENGGEHAKQMGMKVSKIRVKDVKVLKSGLKYAKIQVDGSYFDRREAVTFSSTGFIGFCGELSEVNAEPILKAFVRWCDALKNKTRLEAMS